MLEQLIEDWLTNPNPKTERPLIAILQIHAQNTLRSFRIPPYDIDDLSQECIIKMLALLREGYAHRGSELALLSRVCKRKALDFFRKQGRENQRTVEHPSSEGSNNVIDFLSQTEHTPDVTDPEKQYKQEQTKQRVRQVLHQHLSALPSSQRDVIQALYIEERSSEEITQQRFDSQLEEDGIERHQLSEEERRARWKTAQAWFNQAHHRGLRALRIFFNQDEEFSHDAT